MVKPTPITVSEYAVMSAQQCQHLSGSERDLLARMIERELVRQFKKQKA